MSKIIDQLPLMRHPKKYHHFLTQICIVSLSALILFSCCTDQIDSGGGFYFTDAFGAKITKIDLVGANKTIYNRDSLSQVNVTLNPADTLSRYVVYYSNDTGTVEIAYQKELSYVDASCDENLVVVYKPRISNTTFFNVRIDDGIFGQKYIEITR